MLGAGPGKKPKEGNLLFAHHDGFVLLSAKWSGVLQCVPCLHQNPLMSWHLLRFVKRGTGTILNYTIEIGKHIINMIVLAGVTCVIRELFLELDTLIGNCNEALSI